MLFISLQFISFLVQDVIPVTLVKLSATSQLELRSIWEQTRTLIFTNTSMKMMSVKIVHPQIALQSLIVLLLLLD